MASFKYPLFSHTLPHHNHLPLPQPKSHPILSVFFNCNRITMALRAVNVCSVPHLDHHHHHHIESSPSFSTRSHFSQVSTNATPFNAPKFLVIGHRGNGMNALLSSDSRMTEIKENTILSFNSAANHPLDFIEFDVQVTKDGFPIIFHDDFIFSSDDDGKISERKVPELSLSEFLSYGPQKESGLSGKTLSRKTKNGKIVDWEVETDDSLCTLQDAFQKVNPCIGFNIELKFDDYAVYQQENLTDILQSVLRVVFEHANGRPVMFSTFQPDAALLVKKLQSTYPVFFLTEGGTEIYYDERRNSLEEAVKLCLEGGLEGIVSEALGVFRNPGAVNKIKESNLSLLTYGKLNNVLEAVYMQHLMGIDGVIVDFVQEITEGVAKMVMPSGEEEEVLIKGGREDIQVVGSNKPQFSQRELAFLLKLIPELIQQQ